MPALTSKFRPFERDLKIDFLRGLVMFVVIIVHLEYFSFFAMFAWERVGLVSSAEGFVALSGWVVGMSCNKKLHRSGFKPTIKKLFSRSLQLYSIHIIVSLSIVILGLFPFIDTHSLTHWVLTGTQSPVISLYPSSTSPWYDVLMRIIFLKSTPHQFQIIGLYIVLMACAPLALYAIHKRQTKLLLLISWGIYLANQILHYRLSGARFEWAFPTLSWQLLFFNCMAAGYHHQKIINYFDRTKHSSLLIVTALFSLCFAFVALNKPHLAFWPLPPLSIISPDFFTPAYDLLFRKGTLGIGRVFNNLVLYVFAYGLLNRHWQFFYRYIGWLLIPLGQASLYVFIVHIYFILLINNTSIASHDNFFLNTLVHAGCILGIWFMVKKKFLFKFIPR